jgi:ABC-2 type transport system permease protein
MRRVLRIARREYLAAVKTKGFLIGLVLAPVLMGGGALGFTLLKGRLDLTDRKIAVIDRSGVVAEALVAAARERETNAVYDAASSRKLRPSYTIEPVAPDDRNPEGQRLELSDRIRRGDLHAFVEIGSEVLHPGTNSEETQIRYYARNAALDDVRQWLGSPINQQLRKARLAELGVAEAAMKDLFDWRQVEARGLASLDQATGKVTDAPKRGELEAVIIPMVMVMLMFLMAMMGAIPLMGAVMEEKSQRIAEVMLGSVRPFEFMMGKVLGGLGVSLTGSLVYWLGGGIVVVSMGLTGFITAQLAVWFFIFMLLNTIMLGSMLAGLGSICSDPRDVQNLTLPAMIPVLIPLWVMVPVLKEPGGAFATWFSLFPPFTPPLMVARLSAPAGVPAWQPWAGLLGVLVCAALAVWIGGRIFRMGILFQGKLPKFGQVVRWALRG